MPVQKADKCTTCGAVLQGPERNGKITCTFCGTENIIVHFDQKANQVFCPNCGAGNLSGSNHCSECGAQLILNCPKCGTPNHAQVNFCIKCGEEIRQKNSGLSMNQPLILKGDREPIASAPIPGLSPAYSLIPPHNSNLALMSLIFGIAGIFVLPVICSFVAILTGSKATKEINNSGGAITGKRMAKAGMILGYLGLTFGCFLVFILLANLQSG
ncbi:MAG: DUF4190 domain-containing protein [Chloroflexi bacterium]|nr:DUF4190 domain-containing protein [Chloroflexota bacterium]